MEIFAIRQFQHNLQDHVRQVQADLPQAPEDLSPPDFMQDALKELRLLMLSYDSSLAPPAEKETEFMSILAEALDPYLRGCESLANDLRSPSSHVFMINCLLASKVISLPNSILQQSLIPHRPRSSNSPSPGIKLEYWTNHLMQLHPLLWVISMGTFCTLLGCCP